MGILERYRLVKGSVVLRAYEPPGISPRLTALLLHKEPDANAFRLIYAKGAPLVSKTNTSSGPDS
jgi:hypothetical protein